MLLALIFMNPDRAARNARLAARLAKIRGDGRPA
jgi:hypothetical protein